MMRGTALTAFILLAGIAFEAARAQQAPAAQAAAPVAVADHHQHLVSPAGADWLYARTMPTVDVPGRLQGLLERRTAGWNDAAALAPLYDEDAVAFTSANLDPASAEGRAAVAELLANVFGRPFRMTPFAIRNMGAETHIGGYLTRGEGRASRHFGHFYLRVRQDQNGEVRIRTESLTFPAPPGQALIDAQRLIELLDEAGIRQAVVLSDAYWFDGKDEPESPQSYQSVRAENDWTAAEVARFPNRLVAFCSFNPLRAHALAELERCAADDRFTGIKLHFGVAGVELSNPAHVAVLRGVFQAANRHRMPIILHARGGPSYGREHAEILLSQILPAAPDVVVQIAHLWGGEAFSDEALSVYAAAVAAGHQATRRLYFDIADAALVAAGNAAMLETLAQRIRQIGAGRILYGSDAVGPAHPTPRDAWAATLRELPLTSEEVRVIAGNIAPYVANPGRR